MEGGPPMFGQDSSCPALLKDAAAFYPYGAVTRSGPPFQTVPVLIRSATGLVPFRSPLLGESRLMSFPPATEMFQFAGFASTLFQGRYRFTRWVSPFGDLRIIGCSPLPEAFRRVPRPSSPLGAKASTKCPYLSLENLSIPMRQHTTRCQKTDVGCQSDHCLTKRALFAKGICTHTNTHGRANR